MEWIWIIFIVFTIISSLAEKQKKGKKPYIPKKRTTPPGAERPFSNWPKELTDFFGLEEEIKTEERGYSEGARNEASEADSAVEITAPAYDSLEGTKVLGQEGYKSSSEVVKTRKKRGALSNELFFDEEDLGTEGVAFPNGDDQQKQDLEEEDELSLAVNEWDDNRRIKEAVIFAHVLPRPDFRTVPWKRKI